jgi:hypothetical protein
MQTGAAACARCRRGVCVTFPQCMTVVGDTCALLLTREGGGTEQVLARADRSQCAAP